MTNSGRSRFVFALLTFGTLLYAGMWHWALYASILGETVHLWTLQTALHGLWYAGSVSTILLCHEAGHLLACRAHGIPTTGPYFLPSPFVMIGTLGAFIRVHSHYPSRKALLHVGIAGPLLGMVAIVPALLVGLFLSQTSDVHAWPNVVRFGQPWLLTRLQDLLVGPGPIYLHPLAIGAWVGLLFTMVNLIPFRQFDGGHIVRAAFGQRVAKWVSVLSFLVAVYFATKSLTWACVAVVMALDWHHIDAPLQNDTPNFRWGYVTVAAVLFGLCWNQIDVRR